MFVVEAIVFENVFFMELVVYCIEMYIIYDINVIRIFIFNSICLKVIELILLYVYVKVLYVI